MTLQTQDHDAAARRTLFRFRAFATLLMVSMAGLTLATYAMPQTGWTAWLQASAKAGFVGGIADWFAVTALFRHPLGLPIPHTAILPAQKARLGAALGRFVATYVVNENEVAGVLARLDVPDILSRFLSDPASAKPAAEALAQLMPRLLQATRDGRASRALGRLLPRFIGSEDAGRMVARVLRGLVDGGRHQAVLGLILAEFKSSLIGRGGGRRGAMGGGGRAGGGGGGGGGGAAAIARRVLATINAELDRMDPDGSDLRIAFDEWARREIERLESDPARAAEFAAAMRRFLTHETVKVWASETMIGVQAAVAADAAKEGGGRMAQVIALALANLGAVLATDPATRARVQGSVETMAARLLPAAQVNIAGFIGGVVSNWDSATLVDRLELRIGKDLQYVRINGTLVGFLAGGALYLALRFIFGGVSV
jgi:uncharacterized membrane-anchored protein YjiN (DUF445 family)